MHKKLLFSMKDNFFYKLFDACYKKSITSEHAMKLYQQHAPKQYTTNFEYKNDLEFLNIVINIYSLVKLRESLTKKQKDVLRYYLKSGYSDETKNAIRLDFKIKKTHLNQINWALNKKGFLKKHPTNERSKVVSEELIKLRDSFLKDGISMYTVIFQNMNK